MSEAMKSSSVDAALFAKLLEAENKRKEYRRMYNQRPSVKQKQAEYHRERNAMIKAQAEKFAALVEAGVISEEGEVL